MCPLPHVPSSPSAFSNLNQEVAVAAQIDLREVEWTVGGDRQCEETWGNENGEPMETAGDSTADTFFLSKDKFIPQL